MPQGQNIFVHAQLYFVFRLKVQYDLDLCSYGHLLSLFRVYNTSTIIYLMLYNIYTIHIYVNLIEILLISINFCVDFFTYELIFNVEFWFIFAQNSC